MATLDPEVRKVIEEVLREHGANDGLPALSEPRRGFGLGDLLSRYFEGLFGSRDSSGTYAPSTLGKILDFVAENFEWVVFAAVIVGGWFFIFRYLSSRKYGWRSGYDGKLDVVNVSSAREGLQIALSRGNFSEAARWRWRLMLEMNGIFHALTPIEYLDVDPSVARVFNPSLAELYKIMFSHSAVSEDQYRWFSDVMETAHEIPVEKVPAA